MAACHMFAACFCIANMVILMYDAVRAVLCLKPDVEMGMTG